MVTIIELGDVGAAQPATPGRPRVSARMRRTLVAAALVIACLLSVSASQRADPGLAGPLWTGEVSLAGFSLGTRDLYLYEPNGRVAVARDLATGALRWRLDLDLAQFPQWTQDLGYGVTAVVTRGSGQTNGIPPEPTLSLVDDASGKVLSKTVGAPLGVSSGGRLLVAADRPPINCPTFNDACTDVVAYDLHGGELLWRRLLPGYLLSDRAPAAPAIDRFALRSRDGILTLYDAESAAVAGRIAVPLGGQSAGPRINLVGGMIVLSERDQGAVDVTAIGGDPPHRQWSQRVIGVPEPYMASNWFYVDGCGPVLCLHVEGANALIDPVTGAHLATIDHDVAGHLGGGHLLATAPTPQRGPGRPGQTAYVIDHRDGRVLATFPASTLVTWIDSGGRALLAQQGPRRIAFTILDEDGHARHLGSVTGVDVACQARASLLACSGPAGDLRIWRLPP